MRLDLDILLSKWVPPAASAKFDGVTSHKSLEPPASMGRDSKLNARNSELGSVISVSPLGAEEEYWK